MTDPVSDAESLFRDLSRIVRPGTEIFVHHDNFYQPVGHHDHGLLFLNEKLGPLSPKVFGVGRCRRSALPSEAHRASMAERWPWLWSAAPEATLTRPSAKTATTFVEAYHGPI